MFYRTSLVVMGVLFSVSNSITTEQITLEHSRKLSGEVFSAMEGNQATLDSISTMQATVTKRSSHSFPNKKGFQLEQKHRIISDEDHFRKDQLETQFKGPKENRGYARALPVGGVYIESVESNIDYIPPKNMVFVRSPRWSDDYKIRTNDLLHYQSARGATLKENILASAKNGYYFTAKKDKVDGDDCILLTCDYTNPEATLKIWVVPSKGYCIKKIQDISKGKISNEYKTTLKKYSPGIWWFDSVQAIKTTGLETVASILSVDALTLNEPIDPDVFTVWGLDISSKTRIMDEVQGKMFTLAIDDSREETTNKVLVIGLGILGLVAATLLGIFTKVRRSR